MRYSIFLISSILFSLPGFGQGKDQDSVNTKVYSWINEPSIEHLAADEWNISELINVQGPVKEITEGRIQKGGVMFMANKVIRYTHGKITYYKRATDSELMGYGPTFSEYIFTYDSTLNLQEERQIEVYEGDTVAIAKSSAENSILTKRRYTILERSDPGIIQLTYERPVFGPIFNTLDQPEFQKITVNYEYNRFGQKIGATSYDELHNIIEIDTIRYYRSEIVVASTYFFVQKPDEQLVFETHYTLDEYGNWVEKYIVKEGTDDHGLFTWKRSIVYE